MAKEIRGWSNLELRKFAAHITGSVVNVSGNDDMDGQGKRYKDYFSQASSYVITNKSVVQNGDLLLDLSDVENELPHFDVAFCHSVIEHVFEIRIAFSNLCGLANVILLVVPFMYPYHNSDKYEDYWRMTHATINKMFEQNGFWVDYQSFSPNNEMIFTVAKRAIALC